MNDAAAPPLLTSPPEQSLAAVHFERGLAFERQGCWGEAISEFTRALEADPQHYDALVHGSNAAFGLKEYQAALEFLNAAINLKPDCAIAHEKSGDILSFLNLHEAASNFFARALQISPGSAALHTKRGNSFFHRSIFDQALDAYAQAIQLDPRYAEAYNNCGTIFALFAQPDDALACFEQATALDPLYANAHYNKSLIQLARGDFDAGWTSFEWRLKLKGGVPTDALDRHRWHGTESLSGKTLLLHFEQGLGDTLQFCRYAPLLAATGARILLRVQKSLVSTLRTLEGVDQVLGDDEPIPAIDFFCPLMSLPQAFGTRLESIPAETPYLRADPGKRADWQRRLGPRHGLRVGVVWAGGERPGQPELHATNQRRNLPLAQLDRLDLPGVEFFSLQKGASAEAELAQRNANRAEGPRIHDFCADLHDFSDTAALLDSLDLLISVDTSTAHLAGALGKEVWLLSRFDACWRWLNDRSDSPWYPGLTLFRQPRPGDWASVVSAVRERLAKRGQAAITG